MEFEYLKNKIIKDIKVIGSEKIIFTLQNGEQYELWHEEDCCEDVWIDDICGDIGDLVDSEILISELIRSDDETPDGINLPDNCDDSYTWSFYKLSTIKGSVTIRWFGTSNGYYSETVDFDKIN